jgi:hypothetical protein
MDLLKRIKFATVLLIVVVVGYAIYNQYFYEPPYKESTINHPVIVPDREEEDPEEEPFNGVMVEWMPIIDESDRVKLYMSEDELFQSPFVMYKWEKMNLPIYEKIELTFEQINDKTQKLFDQLNIETTNNQCEDYNQDGLKLSMCNFDQGYLEVVQDGSLYVIFHDENTIALDSYELSDINQALQSSWISNLVDLDNMDVMIEEQSYDTFGEKVYQIVIVDKNREFGYKEKYTLMLSYENKSINGISKNSDLGRQIKQYDVLSQVEIDTNIKEGLYYSIMVEPDMLENIIIMGYGLSYDTSMFSNVIIPIVEVYTTSTDSSFTNCFDAEGIVIHPLKVIGINPTNIRAK